MPMGGSPRFLFSAVRPGYCPDDMIGPDIFHRDFTPTPYWWEAYRPSAGELVEVPRAAWVAIVGGGYAGLSAALELARHGIAAVRLRSHALGFGRSTRHRGAVHGRGQLRQSRR